MYCDRVLYLKLNTLSHICCDKGKNEDHMQEVKCQRHRLAGLMIRQVCADDQWDPAEVLVDSPCELVCVRLNDII